MLQAVKAAGVMPAVTKFAGVPALAIGKGSLRTGIAAADKLVSAARSTDPKLRAQALAVVAATQQMARTGTPAQRQAGANALRVLAARVSTPARSTAAQASSPAVARGGWFVNARGEIRVLAA